MNFLLGKTAGELPPRAVPASSSAQPTSARSSFRFGVALGTLSVAPPVVPASPQALVASDSTTTVPPRGHDVSSSGTRISLSPAPSPVAAASTQRYGGALVRVSDLERSGVTNVFASSGLHLRARTGAPPSRTEAPAFVAPNLSEHMQALQNLPLSQLFSTEQPSASAGRARPGAKRARASSTTRGRGRTSGSTRGTARGVGGRRGAVTIALRDNGEPYESSWYTKQHKRYFVYDNKTYRGRQAYKVWKQVQKAEETYRQSHLRTHNASVRGQARSAPESPVAASLLSPTRARQRPSPTLPVHSESAAPRPLSQRARQAVDAARQHESVAAALMRTTSAQPSPLTRLVAAQPTPGSNMVKRPVTAARETMAAIYAARPPASVHRDLSHSAQTPTWVTIEEDEVTEGHVTPSGSLRARAPTTHTSAVLRSAAPAFGRSFFNFSDDESDPGHARESNDESWEKSSTASASSISSCSSDGPMQSDNHVPPIGVDTVTVGDWVYPREVWEQLHTTASSNHVPNVESAAHNSDAHDARAQTDAPQSRPAVGVQLVFGPRAAGSLAPQATLQAWPELAPRTATSRPVSDRYEGGLSELQGDDLEGMFDVAEEHGGMRFQ